MAERIIKGIGNISTTKEERDMLKAEIFLPHNHIPMPEEVYILGSGPNGNLWTPTKNHYVIACNSAIKKHIGAAVWIVADANARKAPWFPTADFQYEGRRVFCHALADISKYWDYKKGDRLFKLKGHYDEEPKFSLEGSRFRPDESVAGCAINLAYLMGVKRINLAGIDMSGDTYFDSSPCKPKDPKAGGEVWGFTASLNRMIWWMMSQGLIIKSVTDTKLSIPEV